jgi:hypothetical protein
MCMQTRHGHQLSQMVLKLPTVEWVAEELSSGLSFKYSSWSRSRAAEEEWLVTREEFWSCGCLEWLSCTIADAPSLTYEHASKARSPLVLNGVNTAHIWVNVSENDVRGIEMHACRCSICAHATRQDCYQKSSCDCLSIRVHSSFLVTFYLSKVRLTPKAPGMAAMAARAVQRSFELLNENALAL